MYSGGAVAYAAYGEGGYPMSPTEILLDAFFAAVAGTGFGTISDPPANALPRIACLAAVGHALRFVLMHWGMDIATASFIAGFAIGSCSLILAMLLLHWAILSIPKTKLYGITEDYFLALCTIPAIYLFLKNYITQVLVEPTKPSKRVLEYSLFLLCATIGTFFSVMILRQFSVL